MSKTNQIFSAYSWSIFVIGLYITIALLAPIIANQYPLACKSEDKWLFPAIFSSDRQKLLSNRNHLSKSVMPIIPFGPQATDIEQGASRKPGYINKERKKHWLGTDKLGRDVAAGMIYGTKTAIQIGFISVLFSFLIGVSLGMTSAYTQEEGIKLSVLQILILIGSLGLLIFYIYYEWQFESLKVGNLCFYILSFCLFNFLFYRLSNLYSKSKKIKIDLDLLLVKAIEIRKSFPGIFILLALTSLFVVPSVWNIVMIITLLSWTEFARFARAETLAVKNENYIIAVKILGLGPSRIIFRHIWPNILSSLVVIACFSVGSAILLESTLSFLGIGLPVEQVTWGKMMAEGRDMQSWWMVLFPGLALFIIILCLNTISDVLTGKNSVMKN